MTVRAEKLKAATRAVREVSQIVVGENPSPAEYFERIAYAALHATPDTIITLEELNSVTGNVVIRSNTGAIYDMSYIIGHPEYRWWERTGDSRYHQSESIDLPAHVLYRSGEES